MFETLEQQQRAAGNSEKAEADASHSWPIFGHPPALTSEQLRCLNVRAQQLGRPLTAEEAASLLGDKLPQAPPPVVHRISFI